MHQQQCRGELPLRRLAAQAYPDPKITGRLQVLLLVVAAQLPCLRVSVALLSDPSPCGIGFGVLSAATATCDTVCEQCRPGNYSDVISANANATCKACDYNIDCPNEVIHLCRAGSAPYCTSCAEENRYRNGGGDCVDCGGCSQGEIIVQECTATNRTICEPIGNRTISPTEDRCTPTTGTQTQLPTNGSGTPSATSDLTEPTGAAVQPATGSTSAELSTGGIVGIVLGLAAVIVVVAVLIIYHKKVKRLSGHDTEVPKTEPEKKTEGDDKLAAAETDNARGAAPPQGDAAVGTQQVAPPISPLRNSEEHDLGNTNARVKNGATQSANARSAPRTGDTLNSPELPGAEAPGTTGKAASQDDGDGPVVTIDAKEESRRTGVLPAQLALARGGGPDPVTTFPVQPRGTDSGNNIDTSV